jgi:hypothetical protein
VLFVCESVRVPRFKVFSPLMNFHEIWNESHAIAGHFSRVRFSFLQSATRRSGLRTYKTKETLTSPAEIMHSNSLKYGYVARMREERGVYRVLVGKPEVKKKTTGETRA